MNKVNNNILAPIDFHHQQHQPSMLFHPQPYHPPGHGHFGYKVPFHQQHQHQQQQQHVSFHLHQQQQTPSMNGSSLMSVPSRPSHLHQRSQSLPASFSNKKKSMMNRKRKNRSRGGGERQSNNKRGPRVVPMAALQLNMNNLGPYPLPKSPIRDENRHHDHHHHHHHHAAGEKQYDSTNICASLYMPPPPPKGSDISNYTSAFHTPLSMPRARTLSPQENSATLTTAISSSLVGECGNESDWEMRDEDFEYDDEKEETPVTQQLDSDYDSGDDDDDGDQEDLFGLSFIEDE